MTKNIFKLVCSTLLALCVGVFTSCDPLGNPDFKFKEEYEVLMGKWTCETYLEGEPYTLQFTFNKNGKVKVREIFEGDDFSTEMLFNIEGDLSEGAEVIIFGGKGWMADLQKPGLLSSLSTETRPSSSKMEKKWFSNGKNNAWQAIIR